MRNKPTSIILEKMRQIYYGGINKDATGYLDWMGYQIDEQNTPSYHHIERAAKQKHSTDMPTIENGAYLGEYSHAALHEIERNDIELYNRWNELFKRIILEGKYPSNEIWEQVLILQQESYALFDRLNNQKKKKKKR